MSCVCVCVYMCAGFDNIMRTMSGITAGLIRTNGPYGDQKNKDGLGVMICI